MLLLLLMPLLQAAAPSVRAGQAPDLPAVVLAAEISQPRELAQALAEGELSRALRASPLWDALRLQKPYAGMAIGWALTLAPVRGELHQAVDALAGDGLLVMAYPGAPAQELHWAVVAAGRDGDLAQSCLTTLLTFAGIGAAQLAGESWQVELGEVLLRRSGDRFLIGNHAERLDALATQDYAALRDQALPLEMRQASKNRGVRAWIDGALLRVNGYPELPDNAGASLLFGEIHEVLRTAAWLGVGFDFDGQRLRAEAFAPAADDLRTTHQPLLPDTHTVLLPQLETTLLRGVLARDLGGWWTARHLYMNERAVAGSLEGDGVFAQLFGRDLGSEVLAMLEAEVCVLVAPLPDGENADLAIEYPALAIGLRRRAAAPQDLGAAFQNAFLAAIALANFQTGMGADQLQLGMESIPSGTLVHAHYPPPAAELKRPLAHNLSPALLLTTQDFLWLSTSTGLLRQIAAAPSAAVTADGLWLEIDAPGVRGLFQRNRQALVANRVLEEGGDLEAAEKFVDLLDAAAALLTAARLSTGLGEGVFRLQVVIDATQ